MSQKKAKQARKEEEQETRQVPTRRVSGNSYVIEGADKKLYRPHFGEWVDFYDLPESVDSYLLRLKTDTMETVEQVEREVDRISRNVTERIAAWSFTDPRGRAYPNPPDEATLKRLSFEELTWLRRASVGMDEDASKNSDGGSTNSSTEPEPLPSNGSSPESVKNSPARLRKR